VPEAVPIEVATIPDFQAHALAEWYVAAPDEIPVYQSLSEAVLAQHYCNFRLWNLEDQARRTDVSADRIVRVKQGIDGWNQRRNDLVEVLDSLILAALPEPSPDRAQQHSETAGMMIDRLSILSLKIHHMRINAGRDDDPELAAECVGKLATLEEQRDDLAACLSRLIEQCASGERFFKLYRQHKAYNDPRLNPALSGRGPLV